MPASDIPQLTPEEELTIQGLLGDIPWKDDVDPLVAKADPDDWIAPVIAALEKIGYKPQAHDTKSVLVDSPEVTMDYHSVVVRHSDDWADGIGHAYHYGKRRVSRAVLLLVKDATGGDGVATAQAALRGNVPPVSVWVLDTQARTLDMGDGRVVEVG